MGRHRGNLGTSWYRLDWKLVKGSWYVVGILVVLAPW